MRDDEPLQEVLYIPSPTVVKRMSLGYSGLLADIYWTRVVQYFGTKHRAKSKAIPHPGAAAADDYDAWIRSCFPAYQFGSVFLSQKPPEGAGDPQAAARLVEKGIRENPQAWRLYYDLGYIYWLEMKEPVKAADAFDRGSKVPGALPWMRVMAAALDGARRRNRNRNLHVDQHPEEHRRSEPEANAINRLRCLRVDSEVKLPAGRGWTSSPKQNGRLPASWQELISAGLLRRLPVDPKATLPPGERPGAGCAARAFPFHHARSSAGQEPGDLPGEKGYKVAKELQ